MIDNSNINVYLNNNNEWSDEEEDNETDAEKLNEQYQPVGDTLKEDKTNNTLRIYFQNLNGLKWDKHGGTWPQICQAMSTIQADITGFAEVNQDTLKLELRMKLEQVAGKHFEKLRLVTGTSNRRTRRAFKPGGTMMMTVNKAWALIQDTYRDRMGLTEF